MTTIGDAVARLGFTERDGQDIVASSIRDGKIKNSRLVKSRGTPTTDDRDWYVAGGRFVPGSVTEDRGRTRENLLSVGLLSFDFDLAPFLDEDPEVVLAMPTDVLRRMVVPMQAQAERIAAEIGLPLHVIAYTGHGIVGVVRVEDHGPDALEAIVGAYKGIVDRINAIATGGDAESAAFADPAVSDAGTRLIRLPGTYNCKGREPRLVEVLAERPGEVSVADLVEIGGSAIRDRMATPQAPPVGELSPVTFRQLVDLIRPHWDKGIRNDLAVGIPAAFVKAGISEEQAFAFLEAMPPDEEMHNRRVNFRRAYSRHERGLEITGYYRLQRVLPDEVLTVFDTILDGVRQSQGVRLRVGGGSGRRGPAESFRVSPFPEEAWYPGWFTEYRDLVAPLTEAPPQYHLGAGLVLASATINRRAAARTATGRARRRTPGAPVC